MTVRVKISGLFLDSSDRIFKQSETWFGFGFDSGTDVFGFCGVLWYHSNSVTNCEGTKRCPILYEPEIWAILCVIA